MAQPPPYAPQYSQYQGYPQAPYPPQPVYNPQPVYMYQPPAPQIMQQQQQTNVNVTVGQPSSQVVVVKQGVNHLLHLIITLLFFPWIIVWIIVCLTHG